MIHLRDISFCAPFGCDPTTADQARCELSGTNRDEARVRARAAETSPRLVSSGFLALLFCFALAISGCSGGEANLNSSAADSGSLQSSPTSITFGALPFGQTASSSVSLVNQGSVAVLVSQISVSGQSFSATVANALPIAVPAGGTYNFNVNFSPAAMGTSTGQVMVASSSAADSTLVIELSGTGTAASGAPTSNLSALSCASGSITGTGTDSCTVTVDTAAPSGGMTINLASSNSAAAVPATVTLAAGATTASFTVSVSSVSTAQTATLTASAGGVTETFALQLDAAGQNDVAASALSGLTCDSGSMSGTGTDSCTVTVDPAASSSGVIVDLASSDSAVTVPGSVDIAAGATTASFIATVSSVSTAQTATLTASAAGVTEAFTLQLGAAVLDSTTAPLLSGLTCASGSMSGAGTDICTVELNAAAPSGGLTASLASNNAAVSVPTSVTVQAGATSASFAASVIAVSSAQTVTLTAAVAAVSESFELQLSAAVPSLSLSSTSLSFGSVNLNAAVLQTVSLSSTGSSPVTVSAASATGPGFTISGEALPVTLNPNQTATLTVQFDPVVSGPAVGQVTLTSNSSTGTSTMINLNGTGVPVLSGLSCAIGAMTGAGTDTCTVTLNGGAPSGGFTVSLASNNSAVTVPATVTVSAGAASATFTATSTSVSADQTATLTASADGVSEGFSLQLNDPAAGLSINATSIAFGDVQVNTPVTQSVELTASGLLPIAITAETVEGTGFSISSSTLPLTLAVSQVESIDVTFDPTTAGPATGQLTIVSTSLTSGAAVINLSGSGVLEQVNLTWNAPTSSTDPVAGYNVYRAPSGGTSYQQLNLSIVTQSSYVDPNVVSGQTYDYIVESVDASGVASAPSNMASVTLP